MSISFVDVDISCAKVNNNYEKASEMKLQK